MSAPGSGVGEVAIVDIDDVPPVHSRGGEIRVPISPRAVGAQHHIFGRAVLEPGEAIGEHVHDYGEETLFIVSGTGVLTAEGRSYSVKPGLAIFAPRGSSHAIRNDGTETLVLVFASAPPAPTPASGHREQSSEAAPDVKLEG